MSSNLNQLVSLHWRKFLIVFSLGLIVPVLGFILTSNFSLSLGLEHPYKNPDFLGALESLDILFAMIVSLLLVQFSPHLGLDKKLLPWLVISLLYFVGCLIISDSKEYSNFVYWHRSSVLLGGLTLSGVWLSTYFVRWRGLKSMLPPLVPGAIFLVILLGLENSIIMVDGQNYTSIPKFFYYLGATGYLGAAFWFLLRAMRSSEDLYWYLATYSLTLGFRPVLFLFAGVKSPVWWWSHWLTFLSQLFLFLAITYRVARLIRTLFDRSFFLEQILENVPSMIFVKDAKTLEFQLCNPAGEALLGHSANDLLGKTDRDVFSKEQADHFWKIDRETLSGKNQVDIPEEMIQTKGGEKWLHTRKVPIVDKFGIPLYLLGISDDITEYRKVQKELERERSLSIQQAKMATLGKMASGMAHEINNPLAIIKAKLDLMLFKMNQTGMTQDLIQKELEKINSTSDRISQIVHGLKAFSRNSQSDPKQSTPVKKIISDTLALCAEKIKIDSIDLKVEGDLDLSILCRPSQIAQVLLNLIGNSYDAISPLSEKWIVINSKSENGWLNLSVTDSGPEISKEIVDQMMEPFFTTKEVGQGTGLGLSISSGIIEEHGGSLEYDRKSGHTRFTISLPLHEVSQ